jgi:predicted esterase
VSDTETIEIEHAAAYANGGTGPSAAVILTHGLGDSARGWASAALQLCSELPWTRWVLPSAPNSPVTLNGGMSMPSWYDIAGLTDRAAETCTGIEKSHDTMLRLAAAELEALQETAPGGGPPRLVMAGFSQGGAMSLYTALRWPEADAALPPPAGVLCMSGYLPLPFTATEDLSGLSALRGLPSQPGLPVLLCHGDADPMVRPEWSTATSEKLDELGCSNVDHKWFKGLEHSVNDEELKVVTAWLKEVIPPTK